MDLAVNGWVALQVAESAYSKYILFVKMCFRIMYVGDSQIDILGMTGLYDLLPETGKIKKLTT